MSATKTVLGGDDECVEVNDCGPWSHVSIPQGKYFPRTILLSAVDITASLLRGDSDDVQIEDSETPKSSSVHASKYAVGNTLLIVPYLSRDIFLSTNLIRKLEMSLHLQFPNQV